MTPRRRILFGVIPIPTPAQRIVNALKARAAAEGAFFEAEQCMLNSVQSMLNIDLYPVGDAVMIALRDRAIAEGAFFEAYNCGIVAVQSMANIDLD